MVEFFSVFSAYPVLEGILSASHIFLDGFAWIMANSSIVERLINFGLIDGLYPFRICIDTREYSRSLVVALVFFVFYFFFRLFLRSSFAIGLILCTFGDVVIKKKLIHSIFSSIRFKD